jgi:hypothetical protein
VVGERNVATSRTDAHVLEVAAPPRVWAVLLWGGFHTGDDDDRPFAQLLAEDYTRREHRVFGRHLKLELYERHLDFPTARRAENDDLESGTHAQLVQPNGKVSTWFVVRS